jgi:diacylglycerol kinase family enzyme
MPTFLRLVQRDDRVPLLLTLCDEHGNEIESATAPSGDAAIRIAIRLLARIQTLRRGYRLTVAMGGDGAQR